jgi:hypothetical protein
MSRWLIAALLACGACGLAALVVACSAEDVLSSLAPFPCAADHHCPAGYTCQDDAGCVGSGAYSSTNKNIDDICMTNDECPNFTSCTFGVCPAKTVATGQCPMGRIQVGSDCLINCNVQACPSSLTCIDAPVGSMEQLGKVCVSPAQAAVLDMACTTTNNTPCPVYGYESPYRCVFGACVLSCIGSSGCPSDRVCADPAGGFSPGCFKPCSGTCAGTGQQCVSDGDAGTVCAP